MNLRYLTSTFDLNKFICFGNEVYRGNPYYRDSMSDVLKTLLINKAAYTQHAEISPFFVETGNGTLLRAAFIHHHKQPDILMLSFFEAQKNVQTAVDLMLEEAAAVALRKGLKRIIIGLDAHLNYGVGFLASHFDQIPCFGLSYSPEYYLRYFSGLKTHSFVSYLTPTQSFVLTREQPILERIKRKGFTFRYADMKQLPREIEIYTNLNNLCFKDHLWWADRTFAEDWELFYPFRWFISGQNLILAEKEGKPVGFMLWYPDYNQLLPPGKALGLAALLKSKLPSLYPVNKIKIAEVGVIPAYQGTGVVLGLFELLSKAAREKYTYCEAGWVEENNLRSKGFGIRWQTLGCEEYKKYYAFEVDI